MRHGFIGRRLNRRPDQRKRLLRSLMGALFRHDHITTTEARAKELRRHAERLITTARRGDLHSRRLALSTLPDPPAVERLFHTVAPRYKERPGGYTRITRIGRRQGDGATVVQIELLDREPATS
ncbi:MAG TPA: 50S ribosomal protein L17 [Chloroflexota bacterium]|jgi:large subunit ribosomal protein L17|nr:50S ribosomal protein L17 [Chloroflexota bacterium]